MLTRSINSTLISAIIAIALGLVMIFYPGLSSDMIGYLLAGYLIIYGVLRTAFNLGMKGLSMSIGELILGIIAVILGIIVFLNPSWIAAILAVVVGIWIVLSAVSILGLAFVARSEMASLALVVLGILDLILGFVVIFNPFKSVLSATVLVGIVIIIHAAFRIIDTLILRKNAVKIAKILK